MTFSSKFGMQRHQATHQEAKQYTCSYCQRQFALPQYLKDHVNLHTGLNPYVCEVPGCDASFKQSSSLSNHKKNFHRNNGQQPAIPPQKRPQNKRVFKIDQKQHTKEAKVSIAFDTLTETSFSNTRFDSQGSSTQPSNSLLESLSNFGTLFGQAQTKRPLEKLDFSEIIRIAEVGDKWTMPSVINSRVLPIPVVKTEPETRLDTSSHVFKPPNFLNAKIYPDSSNPSHQAWSAASNSDPIGVQTITKFGNFNSTFP